MDMDGLIQSIASRVPRDGDVFIGDDGLEYCSRCKTKRQSRIVILGNPRIVPCLCKCMEEEQARKDQETEKRKQALAIERMRENGFPDREMQNCTFGRDDGASPTITAAMRAYVGHFPEFRKQGKGLLLYGGVGAGKSWQAACIVNALIEQGYPCMMTNFSRLTNQLGGMWEEKQGFIDSLGRMALIAIDDLGVERDTEYMTEHVTTIIDSLYRAKVPMVVTSNYTPRQLTEETEMRKKRVYDRLLEVCMPVKVDGPSRRKQRGRDDYGEMKRLLGL